MSKARTKKRTKKNSMPKCDWRYCRNRAELFPVLTMDSPKWVETHKRIEMELDLNVCNTHAVSDTKLFLDDLGWAQLIRNFATRKLPLPERDEIQVIFRALEDRGLAQ